MGYARSARGRSSFGPGFDSPRLHIEPVSCDLTAPHKGAVSRFSLFRYSQDGTTGANIIADRAQTTDFTTARDQVGVFWYGFAITVDCDTFWREF